MRFKQNARKSIGGRIGGKPRNYQAFADLQRSQRLAENGDEQQPQQMTEEDETDLEDGTDHMSNNHVNMTNIGNGLKMTILPVKVVQHAPMEIEKTLTEQTANSASSSGELQCAKDNDSDDFILRVSSSSEKTMPLDTPLTTALKENKACPKKIVRKRRNTSPSSQSETTKKRSKRNQKNSCKKFLDKLNDKNILLNELSDQFDLENILEAYKEKKTKKEVEEEAVRVLGLKSKKDTTNPEIISTLIKFLEMFSTLFVNDDFEETVLNAMKGKLKATKVLEVLDEDEVKIAVIEKFTPTEVLDLLWQKHRSTVSEKLLKSLSVNEIIDQVHSRNDLNTSEPLLMLMLESFSQIVPVELNLSHENTVKSESDTRLLNTLAKVIKSRCYLKSSERLLNIMLRYGPENFSNETKQSIKDVVVQKFSCEDIVDLVKNVLTPPEDIIVID